MPVPGRRPNLQEIGTIFIPYITARISMAGIIAGVLLTLFGMFAIAMLNFMKLTGEAVSGTGIFIVAGGALITYSMEYSYF